MFWRKLRPSVSDPDQLRAQLLRVFNDAKIGHMFTLDDLTDEVRAKHKASVAFLLGQLVSNGVIDQVVAVISPESKGGIATYGDITLVPQILFDPFQLKNIDVDRSMIRIYYTKVRPNSEYARLPTRSKALA
jgi:hypothetical protein